MSNKSIKTALITLIIVLLIANGIAIFWYVQRGNQVVTEPPVFKGFTVEPDPVIPGEPVTVTVSVSGEGVSIEWFETDSNNERTLVAQGQQLVLEETNEPRQFTVVITNNAGEIREYYDYIPVPVFSPSSENTASVHCELRPLVDAMNEPNRGAIYVELSSDASRAAIVNQEADANFNFVTQIDLIDTTTREVIAQFENVYDFVLPVLSDDGTAMTYIEYVDKETFSTAVMHWHNGTITRIADAVPQVSYAGIDMSGDGQTVVLGSNMSLEGNDITATTDLYYYRWNVANGLTLINETPVVLPLSPDTMLPMAPIRISGDGQHIVFAHTADLTGANPEGNVALFMLNADGTITQVTHKFIPAQATLGFFVVNQDGSSVAFTSDEDFVGHNADGSVEIFVWNASADMEQITDTEGNHNVVVLGIVDTSSSVTFLSDADFTDKNPDRNLEFYRWDLQTGFRTLWSPEDGYTQYAVSTGQNMLLADISSDGRALAFPFSSDFSAPPVAFLADCRA